VRRILFALIALAAASVLMPGEAVAQDSWGFTFSKDDRVLREIRWIEPSPGPGLRHVRAITYSAATGEVLRVRDLAPDTQALSVTPDGTIAIILVGGDAQTGRAVLQRVDLETGKAEEVPSKWFDMDDTRPWAEISGDGALVSAYSEEGPDDGPRIVTVYNWRTKTLVAKQSSGFDAGGVDAGGVTPDGKIEFSNNRAGSLIVDPKTGKTLVSYGPSGIRSPDGAWVVNFPTESLDEHADVPILNGLNGQPLGKLDLSLTDDELDSWWRGAFCGVSGKFIASGPDEVLAFQIPSGKKLATFPPDSWKDPKDQDKAVPEVACSSSGKRVAIRDGDRLTFHDLN